MTTMNCVHERDGDRPLAELCNLKDGHFGFLQAFVSEYVWMFMPVSQWGFFFFYERDNITQPIYIDFILINLCTIISSGNSRKLPSTRTSPVLISPDENESAGNVLTYFSSFRREAGFMISPEEKKERKDGDLHGTL